MEDWLRHELVKLRNMLLSQEITLKRFLEISVKQRTLGNQRVNSLLGNFPGNSVDQKGVLDRVELRKHGVHFVIWSVENLHINVN